MVGGFAPTPGRTQVTAASTWPAELFGGSRVIILEVFNDIAHCVVRPGADNGGLRHPGCAAGHGDPGNRAGGADLPRRAPQISPSSASARRDGGGAGCERG